MVCLLRYSNQLNVEDERGATRNSRLGEFAVATHVLLLVLTHVLLLVLTRVLLLVFTAQNYNNFPI